METFKPVSDFKEGDIVTSEYGGGLIYLHKRQSNGSFTTQYKQVDGSFGRGVIGHLAKVKLFTGQLKLF